MLGRYLSRIFFFSSLSLWFPPGWLRSITIPLAFYLSKKRFHVKFTLQITHISCFNQQAEDLAAAMTASKGFPIQADTDGVREFYYISLLVFNQLCCWIPFLIIKQTSSNDLMLLEQCLGSVSVLKIIVVNLLTSSCCYLFLAKWLIAGSNVWHFR